MFNGILIAVECLYLFIQGIGELVGVYHGCWFGSDDSAHVVAVFCWIFGLLCRRISLAIMYVGVDGRTYSFLAIFDVGVGTWWLFFVDVGGAVVVSSVLVK